MSQSPARLSELWLKRGSLAEAELVELYQRVVQLLGPVARRTCSNMPESAEEYVAEFVMEKVIDLTPGHLSNFHIQGDNETKAYIRYAFERFVGDIRRQLRPSGDETEIEARPAPPKSDIGSTVEILAAAGISLDAAVEHAKNFVVTLNRAELIMLSYHNCMDYDDKTAEREHGKGAIPLSELARRYEMKNYYRIATGLGITGKRAGYVADFAQSKIGRWLKRCELQINLDHWEEIRAMLVILCGVVFDTDLDRHQP